MNTPSARRPFTPTQAILDQARRQARAWAGRLRMDEDELLSVAYLALCKAHIAFDPTVQSFSRFAARVVQNEIISAHRVQQSHPPAGEADRQAIDPHPGPAAIAAAREIVAVARTILTDRVFAVFYNRFGLGMTLTEVAAADGRSHETVRKVSLSALETCRRHFGEISAAGSTDTAADQ